MGEVTGQDTGRAIKSAGKRFEPGAEAVSPAEPASPKKKKGEAAKGALVAGVRVAKADAKQLDESLERFELPAGGEAADKIRRLANFFSRKQKELEASEFDVCDVCGGVCLLEVSAPLLGEVCPYCGDGPAAEEQGEPAAAPEPGAAEVAEQLRSDSVVELVPLAQIDLERSPEMRAAPDKDAIELYAQNLDALPAIELVRFDDGALVIVDGWHRYRAAERAERTEIRATIRRGTERDALLAALAANARHGVHRSRADLCVVVRVALRELGAQSNNQLVPIVGVSDKTIAKVRAELEERGEIEASPTRTGKDGKRRKLPKARKPQTPAQRQESERRARGRRQEHEASVQHALDAADPSRVTVVLHVAKSYPQAALTKGRAEVALQDGVRAVVQVKRHSVVLSFERDGVEP